MTEKKDDAQLEKNGSNVPAQLAKIGRNVPSICDEMHSQGVRMLEAYKVREEYLTETRDNALTGETALTYEEQMKQLQNVAKLADRIDRQAELAWRLIHDAALLRVQNRRNWMAIAAAVIAGGFALWVAL